MCVCVCVCVCVCKFYLINHVFIKGNIYPMDLL